MFKWLFKRKETSKKRTPVKNNIPDEIKSVPDTKGLSVDDIITIDMAEAFHVDGNEKAAWISARMLRSKHNMSELEVLLLTGYWVGEKNLK